jgi:hypothetical protein
MKTANRTYYYTLRTRGNDRGVYGTLADAKAAARALNTEPLSAGFVGTPIMISRSDPFRVVLTATVQAGKLWRVVRS